MSQTDTKAAPAADPAAAGPENPAASPESASAASSTAAVPQKPGEIGGPRGPEPTRYGDWESKGRCTDF